MKKLVIFDMDGLMIDSETITFNSYMRTLNEYGYEFNIEMYKTLLGKNAENAKNQMRNWYGETFPLMEVYTLIYNRVQEELKKNIPLKKGLLELLKYLKANNYTMVVATGSVRWRVEDILNSANIASYFKDMVCGDEVENSKPHPEVFLKACAKGNAKVSEALVLEDSESGILASYSGGIDVICIPDMKYPEPQYEEKATAILDSLLDVIPYLENINKAA